MNKTLLLCVAQLCLCYFAFGQIDSAVRYNWQSPSFHDTMRSLLDLDMIANPNDTDEGGEANNLARDATFMGNRISNDVSYGADLYAPLNNALNNFTVNYNDFCLDNNNGGFYGDWHCVGPYINSFGTTGERIGRVTALWVDPSDHNTILAGANSGGLWKTTDGGNNWNNITDASATNGSLVIPGTMGVLCIAVNPQDHDNIYLLLGIESQYKKSGGYSMGMVYTTDGGVHWNTDFDFVSAIGGSPLTPGVTKIAFRPGTQKLFALYQTDVYYKADPATSWAKVTPSGVSAWMSDIDFGKANTSKTVVSTYEQSGVAKLCVTSNDGASWTVLNVSPSGYSINPHDGINRLSLSGSDVAYLYITAHSGTTPEYLLMKTPITSVSLTMLNSAFSDKAQDIEVSWANSNIIYTQINNFGSVNGFGTNALLVSTDEGATWTGAQSGHADGRCLAIYSADPTSYINDEVYYGGDGGICKKAPGQSSAKSIMGNNICITEFYGFGNTEADDGFMYGGAQDNGGFAYIRDNPTPWINLFAAGDGYTAKMTKHGKTAFGEVNGSGDHPMYGVQFTGNTGSIFGINQVTDLGHSNINRPQHFDDGDNARVGYSHIWKMSTPYATQNWGQSYGADPIDGTTGSNKVVSDFYKSEIDNVAYVAYRDPSGSGNDPTTDPYGRLWRTLNSTAGTPTWKNISPPLAEWDGINSVAVDPTNSARIWIAFGNINDSKVNTASSSMTDRVYYSDDYGDTWHDVSKGLSAMPVNKLLMRKGYDDLLYAGTDVGVYKWNKTLQEWQCFNIGLAPSIAMDLEFNNCAGKLRVATYGRGIWETPEYAYDDVPTESDIISTNTTWSSERYIQASVRVTSGHSLTISGSGTVIHMARNAYIVVEHNATLTVNGATITNDCDNCMWKGILTQGDGNAAQTSTNQATVILTGATIEHARRGVMNWDESIPNCGYWHSGAIIHAYNTHFLNCNTGANLTQYDYNLWGSPAAPYDAYFTNCVFEINDDYRGHGFNYPFNAGAQLVGVQGVKFSGCQFYNRDHNTQNKGRGYGIFAYDAGAVLYSYCTGISIPCTSWQRTKFTGFGTGIKAISTLNPFYTTSVDGADFDSCTVGIKTEHYNNLTAVHSTFKIGDGVPAELFTGSCHQNIGIWHTGSEVFGVEDNTFNGYTYTGQPSDMQNIGVIVAQSGSHPNQVYKNGFNDLKKACWALGPNVEPSHGWSGLRFLCNAYNYNDSAIIVNGNNVYEGIDYFQGDFTTSSGNTYTNSTGHLNYLKNTAHGFWYTYHGTGETPTSLSPGPYIGVVSATNSSACSDHFINLPMDNTARAAAKTAWHALKPVRDSLVLDVAGRIDYGNTDSLINFIDTSTSATAVYNRLMSLSPWVSRNAMAEVAGRGLLSGTQLRNIMNANHDLLHEPALISYLANDITPPMSGAVLTALLDSIGVKTVRTYEMAAIGKLNDSLSVTQNMLITDMKDSTYANTDSIPVWLRQVGEEWADYDMVGYYYSRNMMDSALAVLDSIPAKYDFDSLLTVVLAAWADETSGSIDTSMGEDTTGYISGDFGTDILTLDVVLQIQRMKVFDILNYIGYSWIYQIAANRRSDSLTLDSLTAGQVDTLNALASLGDLIELKAGKIAGGILTKNGQWAFPCAESHIIIDIGKVIGHLKPGRDNDNPINSIAKLAVSKLVDKPIEEHNTRKPMGQMEDMLDAFPNPANEYVVFDYRVQNPDGNLWLTITDTRGVKVKQISLGGNSGQARWVTRSVVPGIYFYQLMDDKKMIKSGKVAIIR